MVASAHARFDDPYSYQAAIREADVEFAVTKGGEFKAEVTRIDLQCLWMQLGYQSLPCIARIAETSKRSSILFITGTNDAGTRHNGRELASREIVIDRPDSISYLRTSTPCHWGAMSMMPDDLAAAARSLVGYELHIPRDARMIQPSKERLSRLLRLHRKAASFARKAPGHLTHPEMARAIENALTQAMIACLTEHMSIPNTFASHCHSTVMARFERVLAAEPRKPFYLAEITAATGVSGRTLQACCLENLGIGPVRFLWLRRMHLARRQLMKANPERTNVTTIAMDHGFGELGRFSVAYRSLFGESPSKTLDRTFDVPPVSLGSPFAAAFADSA
jgi:AraC-like DNA-binding protein